MSKKVVFLVFTLLVLSVLSGFYVVGGTEAYVRYQQSNQANQNHCGGQDPVYICVDAPTTIFSAFYPSYIASQSPLFTVKYSSRSDSPMALVVNVSISKFSQVQTRTVNATSAVQSVSFIPPLQDQALRGLVQEENTSLHVEVSDTGGKRYYVNDIPLSLHSRWLMQWVTANRLKIGAWVTPNDPAIAALVTKAAKRLKEQPPPVPTAMSGYSAATPEQVIGQIDALYDTLRLDYHIQYVQATVPYTNTGSGGNAGGGGSEGSGTTNTLEEIKLPFEVLAQRSGMCIELTVLLAAAAERIGLHTAIVITPGHAFLGVAVSPDDKHFEYWDAVDMNNNIAADSANVAANNLYQKHLKQQTIVDTILLSEARSAHIGPML